MQVEPLVRQTLHAVVRRSTEKFEESLRTYPDGNATSKGAEIASAVALYAVVESHGGRPSRSQTDALAGTIAGMESWAEIAVDDIATYLASLVGQQDQGDTLSPETVTVVSIVVAGSLLSSCRRDDEKWWDMLDRAEAAAAAVR